MIFFLWWLGLPQRGQGEQSLADSDFPNPVSPFRFRCGGHTPSQKQKVEKVRMGSIEIKMGFFVVFYLFHISLSFSRCIAGTLLTAQPCTMSVAIAADFHIDCFGPKKQRL